MRRLLPYGCLAATAILVVAVPPPRKLVVLIGSDVWARLGLGVLTALTLLMFLAALGLIVGRVGLPFGLSFESGFAKPPLGGDAVETLTTDISALRGADERIFERIGSIGALLDALSTRLTLLEKRAAADGSPASPDVDVAD